MIHSAAKAPRATPSKRRHFERLTDRLLMAAVIWEDNSPPPGFSAQIEGGALVFSGGPQRDKVIVHDIVANKSHKQLVTGKNYIEIQHQDAKNRLRKGWLEQSQDRTNPLGFTFFGRGGDDHFQYIDTTGDPAERRDRKIIAYGGPGDDSLHGYNQNDILFGDEGKDDLFGELGNDLLVGGEGNDRLWGDGVTRVNPTQSTDADYLEGGAGVDELNGWQGGDILNGGSYWQVNDGAIDKLYGGSQADCFYIEKFADPRKKEANDISLAQGDRPDAFTELVQPPTYDAWLGAFQPGQQARPFNLEAYAAERAILARADARAAYPNLGTNYEVIGPSTTTYNCIAASVGTYSHDVWSTQPSLTWANSVYRPLGFGEPVVYNSAAGRALLADSSQELVVVYGVKGGIGAYLPTGDKISHAAVRSPDGTWVSKLGDLALIRHPTPESVAGPLYGQPLYIYARNRLACGCG